MKNFFLYPSISTLGLVAYIFAAHASMHFSELHWQFVCYSIAGFFNWIVTYDDIQVLRSLQKKWEAMK